MCNESIGSPSFVARFMNLRPLLSLVVFFIGVEVVSGSALAHEAKSTGLCPQAAAALAPVSVDTVLTELRRLYLDTRDTDVIKAQLGAISPLWKWGEEHKHWSSDIVLSDGTVRVELNSRGSVRIKFYSERRFKVEGLMVVRDSEPGTEAVYSWTSISGSVVSQNLAKAKGILDQLRASAPPVTASAGVSPTAAAIQP